MIIDATAVTYAVLSDHHRRRQRSGTSMRAASTSRARSRPIPLTVSRRQMATRRTSPITHVPQAGQGTSLSHVTITGNTSKYVGGLLVEGGYTTLYQSTISNNTATGNAQLIAGGVVAFGSAVLAYASTISGNSVPAGDVGATGGISGYYSLIALVDSTIAGNSATGSDQVAGGLLQIVARRRQRQVRPRHGQQHHQRQLGDLDRSESHRRRAVGRRIRIRRCVLRQFDRRRQHGLHRHHAEPGR